VILDFIPKATQAAGLEALMKGAGKVTRYIPIPQPTLMVGPGSSARMGEVLAARKRWCLTRSRPMHRFR
jgi:alcohol dehydrogenase